MPRGISVGGPATVTLRAHPLEGEDVRARHARVRDVADDPDRGSRRCAPRRRCSVYTSSSAWVGCSCLPSPALTIAALHQRETSSAAPAHGVRMHDRVGLVRAEGEHGVLQRLPLLDAGAAGGEVDDVGGQALGGQLEGAARARGGLVEEVQHHPPAQRGHLLDLAVGDLGEALGLRRRSVRSPRDRVPRSRAGGSCAALSTGRWGDARSRPRRRRRARARARARAPRARWAGSCRRSRGGSAARGGRGRRARPAARARAAVVEQRLDRGAHGAPRVEHVVDDHDRAAGRRRSRCARRARRARRGRRRDVVAVEADVEVARAARRSSSSSLEQQLQALGEEGAAAMDADDRQRDRRCGLRSTISCAMRVSARRTSSSPRTTFSLHCIVSFLASRDRVKGARGNVSAAERRPPGRVCRSRAPWPLAVAIARLAL